MCQLQKFRSSAMSGRLRAIAFVLIFCFAECAAGSCLSYGHSCWGAHGKRSGGTPNENVGAKDYQYPIDDTRWVLSRLIQAPLETRPLKSVNDITLRKHQDNEQTKFNIKDGQDELDLDGPEFLASNEDPLYVDDPISRMRNEDRIRLFKLIKKNVARLN